MKAAGRNPGPVLRQTPGFRFTASGLRSCGRDDAQAFIYTDACRLSGRFAFFAQSVFINLAVQGAFTDSQFIGHLAPVATVLFQQQGNVIGFHFPD